MTTNFSTANPQQFQLVFPLFPEETTFTTQKTFSFNLIDAVVPSIALTPIETPFKGGQVWYEGGGIDFGDWTTKFSVDVNYNSWLLIYDWMMSIANNEDVHGRMDQSYSMDAHLHLLNNYDVKVLDLTFENIWPVNLGEITLSYQESGDAELYCDVTFKYDRFFKTRSEL